MQKKMSISVILAAYRGENYIVEQLRSLFQQTYLPNEILIGDDSPDDLTNQAIHSILHEAPCSVKIYRNNPTLGVTMNFSALLEKASGDIIFFCDQDDVWKKDKIERFVKEFHENPKTLFVFSSSRIVDKDLNDTGVSLSDLHSITDSIAHEINDLEDYSNAYIRALLGCGHNSAIRKELKKYLLPFPEEVPYDVFVYLMALPIASPRCIQGDYVLFRRHDTNFSSLKKENIFQSFASIKKIGPGKQLYDKWIWYKHVLNAIIFCHKNKTLDINKMNNLRILLEKEKYYRFRMISCRHNFFYRIFLFFYLPKYYQFGFGIKTYLRDVLLKVKLTDSQYKNLSDWEEYLHNIFPC